ncbi:hypothetical protein FB45DRAFT_62312 [Roridomyces roridus]|uniref:Uncharacterized protein n=1 Tax=Roridomyces roridus TaxID=1738132 RepID=A0AAD7AYD1_9AGAR|nr:hypothetical protein FB45DRAFT_62312 [Roridomyces roridus]
MVSYAVDERMRLWRKEHQLKLASDLADMRLKHDAELGCKIRELVNHSPRDWQTGVLVLVNAAQQETLTDEMKLNDAFGLKEEAFRLTLLKAAAGQTVAVGEMDPATEVRERIKSDDSSGESYCSPLLVKSLFWEGLDDIPNEHRKVIELQFPERVETLLDFHRVAFHADVAVFKELLDEDLRHDHAKRQQVLSAHKARMEALMKMYAEDFKNRWKKEKERWRTHSRSTSAESAQSGIGGQTGIPRKQTRIADTPVILESAAERKLTAPLRGILKNKSAPEIKQKSPDYTTWTTYRDSDSDSDDLPAPFFLDQLDFLEADVEPVDLEPFNGPEIVVASRSPSASFISASAWSPPYERFHPNPDEEWDPAAVNDNIYPVWQTWAAPGKGKGRAWN